MGDEPHHPPSEPGPWPETPAVARPWPPPDPAATPLERSPYRPIGTLTAWLVGLLVTRLLLTIIDLGMSVAGIATLNRAMQHPGAAAAAFARLGLLEIPFGGIMVLTSIAAAVLFLVWFHRAYRNLRSFDTVLAMRFRAGWAIGAWFVPFLNLVRPASIANDIWYGSDPGLPVGQTRPDHRGRPPLIMAWWLAFLLSSPLGRYVFSSFWEAESRAEWLDAYRLTVVGDVVDLVATPLAIAVVWTLSRRQRERAVLLARAEVLPPMFRHPAYV